ncbi:carbohydrate ABC transporter permease [Myceligenerans indicum]|uniref:Sugar ABC transporter permease n=1 Tax=Myceligenerans indicum TaxID=2593663 RepID=A0ABS1LEY0_9MICO|nr:sugar ABC transporter permease [Myceligenerans indicum]MBL0884758.1 sugar ABC transporter permease [Myceligenerans indicum]
MSALPPATRPRPGGRLTARVSRAGAGFVTPFLIAFALVFIAPLAYSLYLSLFRNQLVGGTQFVGLDNYAAVFVDPKFWDGALRVMLFLAVQVPIMLAIALVAALAIDSGRLHGRRLFRIGLFLPYAVPGVVAAMMWGFMYSDRIGLTGSLNDLAGFDLLAPYAKHWLLVSIGNIVTWEFVGYNMLILYSALKNVPTETYEAAAIDGADQFRIVRHIKLPAVRGALVIATVFSIIGSFQLFNEPQILKGLVPNLISTSYTPNIYAYTLSFQGNQVSYAATVAIVMGVITAGIAYLVQLRGMRRDS